VGLLSPSKSTGSCESEKLNNLLMIIWLIKDRKRMPGLARNRV
jgi:hypothetical protein